MAGKFLTPAQKSEIKKRLFEDGRWPEALEFRENLKAEGVAANEAWRRMAMNFYPEKYVSSGSESSVTSAVAGDSSSVLETLDVGEESEGEESIPDDVGNGNPVNFRADAEWVYLNYGKKTIDMATAPSRGAISWLRRVEKNPKARDTFFDQVLPKLFPSRAQMESESIDDDGRVLTELVDRCRKAIVPHACGDEPTTSL